MNRSLFYLLVLSFVLLDSCTSAHGPIRPPAVQLPEKWSTSSEAIVKEQVSWWRKFNDPQLDALVEKALLTNNDFAAAIIRVRRAQIQAGLIDTNRTPTIAAGANVALMV